MRKFVVAKFVVAGILASAGLNGVVLLVVGGGFGHWLIVAVIATYIGMPALVIAACAYLLRHRFPSAQQVCRAAALVAIIAVASLISLLPGRALVNRDIAAAKAYCESLIPQIDEYQRTHGTYPVDISPIPERGGAPRLLRGRQLPGGSCGYWSDGAQFGFNFDDPRGMMNFIGYGSDSRGWSEWH